MSRRLRLPVQTRLLLGRAVLALVHRIAFTPAGAALCVVGLLIAVVTLPDFPEHDEQPDEAKTVFDTLVK